MVGIEGDSTLGERADKATLEKQNAPQTGTLSNLRGVLYQACLAVLSA
jgi:hypothetical protein